MKGYWKLLVPLFLLVACDDGWDGEEGIRLSADAVEHGLIVLGDKLDDPYTVENMQAAVNSLYGTRAGRVDVAVTDLYVRFLPADEDQLARLTGAGLELMDHPMDYEIVREGDYYHDPSLDEDAITWQYAVVGKDFDFPADIRYEVLDECFLPENAATKSDGIDWRAVEEEAYRLTGNGFLPVPETRAASRQPAGRITIVDPQANGGKPFGVAGVKVACNAFVKVGTAYTDRDGYYRMDKGFTSQVRYRLVFQNTAGFSIGLNLVLVPASLSTLGQGDPSGMDAVVTGTSDAALFRRCVVNNAAYDYIRRCTEDDMDVKAPPKDLRIWIFKDLDASSTVMMHHGAIVEMTALDKYLGWYKYLAKVFLPDVTIGTRGRETYPAIYASVVHELAHASHYAQVGNDYWNRFIGYIATSFLTSGGVTYGSGTGKSAGYCEVGEMWAYFMESKLYKERYGGTVPSFGTSFWFYPQILRYLDERGLTRGDIFRAFTSDVASRQQLQDKLVKLYPQRQAMIGQVFERYAD